MSETMTPEPTARRYPRLTTESAAIVQSRAEVASMAAELRKMIRRMKRLQVRLHRAAEKAVTVATLDGERVTAEQWAADCLDAWREELLLRSREIARHSRANYAAAIRREAASDRRHAQRLAQREACARPGDEDPLTVLDRERAEILDVREAIRAQHRRLVGISRRLATAARCGEVVARDEDGKGWTVEEWISDLIGAENESPIAELAGVIRDLTSAARQDFRPDIRKLCADEAAP